MSINAYEKEYTQLVGKKIVAVVKSPVDKYNPDPFYGFKFDDGTVAWIQNDPEGNGPGFVSIEKK